MWLFLPCGFFSVVQRAGETDLQVRARVAEDLEALRQYCPQLGPTIRTPQADYAYRALVSHEAWSMALAAIARTIHYPNFKNAVYQRQGARRAALYGRVWSILLELQRHLGVSAPLFAGLDDLDGLDGLDEVDEVDEPISPPSARPARKGRPKTAGPGRR